LDMVLTPCWTWQRLNADSSYLRLFCLSRFLRAGPVLPAALGGCTAAPGCILCCLHLWVPAPAVHLSACLLFCLFLLPGVPATRCLGGLQVWNTSAGWSAGGICLPPHFWSAVQVGACFRCLPSDVALRGFQDRVQTSAWPLLQHGPASLHPPLLSLTPLTSLLLSPASLLTSPLLPLPRCVSLLESAWVPFWVLNLHAFSAERLGVGTAGAGAGALPGWCLLCQVCRCSIQVQYLGGWAACFWRLEVGARYQVRFCLFCGAVAAARTADSGCAALQRGCWHSYAPRAGLDDAPAPPARNGSRARAPRCALNARGT